MVEVHTYCEDNLCAPWYRVENWTSSRHYDVYEFKCDTVGNCAGWTFKATAPPGYYWSSDSLTENYGYRVRAVEAGRSPTDLNYLKMESAPFVGGPGIGAIFKLY